MVKRSPRRVGRTVSSLRCSPVLPCAPSRVLPWECKRAGSAARQGRVGAWAGRVTRRHVAR